MAQVIYPTQVGRKTMLLMGSLGMFSTLAAVGILTQLFDLDSCGDEGVPIMGYIIVGLVGVYKVTFACTWSGGVFVLVSEIFPLEMKGRRE